MKKMRKCDAIRLQKSKNRWNASIAQTCEAWLGESLSSSRVSPTPIAHVPFVTPAFLPPALFFTLSLFVQCHTRRRCFINLSPWTANHAEQNSSVACPCPEGGNRFELGWQQRIMNLKQQAPFQSEAFFMVYICLATEKPTFGMTTESPFKCGKSPW